jgi:hypothetical protein
MTLPGGPAHPLARNEVEAQNQIVQLLFQLVSTLNSIRTELSGINSKIQNLSARLH